MGRQAERGGSRSQEFRPGSQVFVYENADELICICMS